jgi:hypothetical protein
MVASTLFLACSLSWSSADATNQVLVYTGFESAEFATGMPVDDRGGWLGLWAPGASTVVESGPESGRRCVQFRGDRLGFARPGLVAGTIGPALSFDPVAAARPLVRFSAGVRLDGPDTGSGPEDDLLSANLFVVNDADQVMGGFFVSSNGTIYAFARGGQDYLFPTPYLAGTYVRLTIDIDFDTMTETFSVDGLPIGTVDLDPLRTLRSTRLATLALELAALDDSYVLDRSLYTARFDNVFVLAAPARSPR